MVRRRRMAELWLALAFAAAAGCSEPPAPASTALGDLLNLPGLGGSDAPSLVVGVTSDFAAGLDVTEILATVSVGHVSEPPRRLDLTGDAAGQFPLEIALPHAPEGAALSVTLDARGPSGGSVVVRTAETAAREGRTLLLRIRLEEECSPSPLFDESETCGEGLSCLAGKCQPTFFWPETLEDYTSDWSDPFADACKPLGAGAAEVTIGAGQSAFEEVSTLGGIVLEAGVQGGHHVWLAVRAKNLHAEGSLTFVDARIGSLGMTLRSAVYPASYAKAGEGCEAAGLLFQLFPESGNDLVPADVLGHSMTVGVTVLDIEGDVGHAEITAPLAPE